MIALWLLACTPPADAPLRVFAAASLTEAFHDVERAFEATHPDVDVVLTLAGSQVLRLQVEAGAPADVIASANPAHVDALHAGGHAAAPRRFAHNGLAVITPPTGSPVRSFADLPLAEHVVLGTAQVPVGAYARTALSRATREMPGFADRVMARLASEEVSVRLVRAKVELGEADAAIVYRTDAAAAGDRVRTLPVPPAYDVMATYPIAAVTRAGRHPAADAFVDFVLDDAAQALLAQHGFDAP